MKRFNTIYLLGLLLCVVGCSEDHNADGTLRESVVISMTLDTASSSRAADPVAHEGLLGSAESLIDKLRVYVFSSNGELDKVEIYTDLNANHTLSKEIEVPRDMSKELYFVANEPAAATATLDAVTSAEELEQVEFTLAAEMNKGFNAASVPTGFTMPMTAKYSVANALSDINIFVGLTRAVARVDLYLEKGVSLTSREVAFAATSKLSASGVTDVTRLMEGNSCDAGAPRTLETFSSKVVLKCGAPQRVLSFYTTERDYSLMGSPIAITVDGMVDNEENIYGKSVTLGDAGTLSQIERNHVYQIYATYNGSDKEIVAEELEKMDWVDVEVSGEIEGVMIAVDSEVAMDWLRNGNSYTSKSVSFGSNKPIEFLLPVAKGSDGSYTFEPYTFADMSAGQSYDLSKITLANNYIYETPWIESATIHFTSPQSGYVSFVYDTKRVDFRRQIYPIRIKSDNVTRQMKAVYDNGYIPAAQLDSDWAKRAPGGVVFAKRGEAKHPTSTPEILYRDEDGYYRGEHSTTAAEASRYCEESFGKGWYAPSYQDMVTIAELYDMLGVSYRLQNNGSAEGSGALTESLYWTSTPSKEQPGRYWAADFMSREYMINDLMERRDEGESNFVRCVMDLK